MTTPALRDARSSAELLQSAARAVMLAIVLSSTLGGCGYRELKAPCGPDEGKPAALSYAPVAPSADMGSPLDRLAIGSIAVVDCGPLRPINNGLNNHPAFAAVPSGIDP